MNSTDAIWQALAHVTAAGKDLEQARRLLVSRARVALASGADVRAVAESAGVDARTLRSWLTSPTGPSTDHK